MVKITAVFCREQKYKKILLIGTKTLTSSCLYQNYLKHEGIESILLPEDDSRMLHSEIMQATT